MCIITPDDIMTHVGNVEYDEFLMLIFISLILNSQIKKGGLG